MKKILPSLDRQLKSNVLRDVEQGQLTLTRVPKMSDIPLDLVLKQRHLGSAIALCVQLSGLDDKEVYLTLGIDAGHWSRILKGDAHFPVNKLNDLMDICGNEAPLIWLSYSRGYALVLLQSEAERRAEMAEQALEKEREKSKMLMDILKNRDLTV